MSKNTVIIGATSGIGRALAVELHARGYTVGLTGRRTERLEKLEKKLKKRVHTQYMDVSNPEESLRYLQELLDKMNGMDIIVLNAGIASVQKSVTWKKEQQVIDVNIRGFAALANFSFEYFEGRGQGHIVGISSIASLFGYGLSATYNASKAFVNIYLQGYRQRANHSDADIAVTNVMPGYVRSEMTKGKKGMFWVAEVEKAVQQLADAIEQKHNHVYITRRWRLIAWLIKLIPNRFWDRL